MRRLPPALRLGGLAIAVASTFVIVAVSGSLSADRVRDWVDGLGVAGPIAFVAVSAALGCVCFPGPLLAGAAGLLFGTALGTPVAVVGATLTALAAASISRFVAGDAVERIGGRRIGLLAAFLERRGFLSVLAIRLLPGVPYNLCNYALGLTRIPLATIAPATALGTAPRTFAYVALGGSFGDFSRPETKAAVAIIIAMWIGGLAVGIAQSRGRLRLPGSASATSSPGVRSEARP
ncbi:MAG: TVP38/TMEM64 family protein [Solirubrobacteraceae bacterium]|nr:TVP38/TMEM64 family protein [Solirubrobacteraceae bacterium]